MSHSLLNSHLLLNVLESHLSKLTSVSLFDAQGSSLYLKYEEVTDISSLPFILQSCLKYLNIDENDIAIVNDPNSGGSLLSNIFFVKKVKIPLKPKPTILWIVSKVALKPRLSTDKSEDIEGVRIPPMPIYSKAKINMDVLEAIASHKNASYDFLEKSKKQIEELAKVDFNYLDESEKQLFTKQNIKEYFVNSKRRFELCLRDFAKGDSNTAQQLADGSIIKLKIRVTDDQFLFDFNGSSKAQKIQLTESGTTGAVIGAVTKLMQKPSMALNQSFLDGISIIAPEGSLVNAKNDITSLTWSLKDGVTLLVNLITESLFSMDETKAKTQISSSHCNIDLQFANKKYFFDFNQMGGAASADTKGQDAINNWSQKGIHYSIEEIERRYPVLYQEIFIRDNSGGDGFNPGGNGIQKCISVSEDSSFHWAIIEKNQPKGLKGGKAGMAPNIFILDSKDKKITLEDSGEMKLKAHSKIVVQTAGGGGYGEAISEEDNDDTD